MVIACLFSRLPHITTIKDLYVTETNKKKKKKKKKKKNQILVHCNFTQSFNILTFWIRILLVDGFHVPWEIQQDVSLNQSNIKRTQMTCLVIYTENININISESDIKELQYQNMVTHSHTHVWVCKFFENCEIKMQDLWYFRLWVWRVTIMWDLMPHSLIASYQYFGETSCTHNQGRTMF